MAYINVKQVNTSSTGIKPWIPVNRWTNGSNYTIICSVDGVATYTLETTIEMLNRLTADELAAVVACPVENAVDLSGSSCLNIFSTPAEAFRINQTAGAGTVTMHIMQAGDYV